MSLKEYAEHLFGITLNEPQLQQFNQLAKELVDWNSRVNLTAITDRDEIIVRHFLDSLSLIPYVSEEQSMKVLDVGTGAGFPGLPLAIARPEWQLTLMEATAKKLTFISHIIEMLGLQNGAVLHARAEETGQNPEHRETYDLVVARAVARLPSLLEYLLPLTKIGGYSIAMKGRTAYEEVDSAGKALQLLGGALHGIKKIELPGVDQAHYLVIVEKVKTTLPQYPRNPGTPTRKPIS